MSFLSKLQSQAISNKMFCWLSALSGICLFYTPPTPRKRAFPYSLPVLVLLVKSWQSCEPWSLESPACWRPLELPRCLPSIGRSRIIGETGKKVAQLQVQLSYKGDLGVTLISFNGDKVQPDWKKLFLLQSKMEIGLSNQGLIMGSIIYVPYGRWLVSNDFVITTWSWPYLSTDRSLEGPEWESMNHIMKQGPSCKIGIAPNFGWQNWKSMLLNQ